MIHQHSTCKFVKAENSSVCVPFVCISFLDVHSQGLKTVLLSVLYFLVHK